MNAELEQKLEILKQILDAYKIQELQIRELRQSLETLEAQIRNLRNDN